MYQTMIFNKSNYMYHNMNLIIVHNLIVLAILWPLLLLISVAYSTTSAVLRWLCITVTASFTNPKLLSWENLAPL